MDVSELENMIAALTAERDALRDEMAARVGSLVAAVKDESWNVRIAERERDALKARVDELMGLLSKTHVEIEDWHISPRIEMKRGGKPDYSWLVYKDGYKSRIYRKFAEALAAVREHQKGTT